LSEVKVTVTPLITESLVRFSKVSLISA
jgi:hypothetical protein